MKKFALMLLMLLSSWTRIEAAADFDTDFHSRYHVQPDNSTQVTHTIKITNKLAYVYLKKYTISLGSDKINHLLVTAEGKKIPASVRTQGYSTDLEISLPQPVIGMGQELHLTIAYDTPSVAVRYGDALEINIPRLNKANEAAVYTREIVVPAQYGEPRVTSPHPTRMEKGDGGDIILTYSGYPSDSITLLFGDKLSYQVDLTYHIANKSPSTADTEIAIPPDTEYQRVLIDEINPPPKFIKQDQDGNWLAIYTLKGASQETVHAKMHITVYPLPQFAATTRHSQELTQKAKYWDTKSAVVTGLAAKLTTPQLMYNYVVDTLTYDYDKVGVDSIRLGGAKVLEFPTSAICTEFTDAFISLARAAGIPAREINGVTYMGNASLRTATSEDFLHAWPEYFDAQSNAWIQVDPTLGKTTGGVNYFNKMDYGHIAFVRHGRESTYPYPAGSYKTDVSEKTVSVTLADSIPADKIDYSIVLQDDMFRITNTGNVALRQTNVELPDGSSTLVEYLAPRARLDVARTRGGAVSGITQAFNSVWSLLRRLLHLNS